MSIFAAAREMVNIRGKKRAGSSTRSTRKNRPESGKLAHTTTSSPETPSIGGRLEYAGK
jgi:hypothetical protein